MNDITIFSYFPDNFMDKAVNEPFIAFIMSKYLGINLNNWKQGDPNQSIPDYIVDNCYYEFTLASDRAKNNLIRKLQKVTYCSQNAIKDAWQCIQASLDSKMGKNYSVNNISVCILCLLDFNENIVAEDGSMSADIFKLFHDEIYDSLQCDYVDKGKFQNIYVIFPFSDETWWVMDIVKRSISQIKLSESEIKTGNYPFFSKNMDYFNFFNSEVSGAGMLENQELRNMNK